MIGRILQFEIDADEINGTESEGGFLDRTVFAQTVSQFADETLLQPVVEIEEIPPVHQEDYDEEQEKEGCYERFTDHNA